MTLNHYNKKADPAYNLSSPAIFHREDPQLSTPLLEKILALLVLSPCLIREKSHLMC